MARVLIVDDDDSCAALVRRLVEQLGHEACVAGTVREGLAALSSGRFDALVTDLLLPDGSGAQVASVFGTRERTIAVSGYERPAAGNNQLPFAHHVLKPLDINSFDALLARVLAEPVHAG